MPLFGDPVSDKKLSDLITGSPQPTATPAPQSQDNMPVGGALPQTEEPLAVGGESPKNSSADTLESRSTKFKYGLGDLLQKSKDEIYQSLSDGKEEELRATAASTIDERKQKATQDLLVKTAANKQGPLTPAERDGIVEMIYQMNAQTDPNTVLETAYGKQFMASLDRAQENNPDNVVTDAEKVSPEEVARLKMSHSSLVTKQQVVNTLLEDAEDAVRGQSYIGRGYDIAKGFLPGYEDVQLRGMGPDVGVFAGGGLGANLEESRKAFMRLPPDELYTQLKAKIQPLMDHNPSAAVEFLKAMQGMSSDDIMVKNFSLPTSLIGLGIGGKAGSAVRKVITGVGQELPKEATVINTSLMKGMSSGDILKLTDTQRAVEQMSKAAGMPGTSKSTMEAAAGDLAESAVTRATTQAVADVQNLPQATRNGIEALTSTLRPDEDAMRANPGRFGQDIVNRIVERGNQVFSNLIDTAVNVQKNERLPDVLSNESAVRIIVEDMKDKYRDLRNSIINTSGIYKEPLSNTYLVDFLIGKNDGTYFTQRSVAENFVNYHGLRGAEIVEGTDAKFTADAVARAKADKNIKGAQAIIERENTKLKDTALSDAARAKSAEQIQIAEDYIVDQAATRHAAKQTVTVEQQGLGYYIRITKPVDETRPVIRDALAQTRNTQIPESPVAFFMSNWIGKAAGAVAGKLRTPEEVLSLAERQNRLTTTYAPSVYFKIMVDNAKEIKGLQAGRFSKGRKRWEEWQRGLENAQELPDPTDASRKGYFFQSPGEMESYWQQWFHRLPDEQEVGAYFEFKRGMEIDRVFRNIAQQRNAQRVGAETHNIVLKDAAGKDMLSADFAGVRRQKLPGAADNIAIFTDKLAGEKITDLSRMSTAAKKDIQKDIDSGAVKLIELYNPKERPLSGYSNITDERIRYVLVPQSETRPLDWNHVPRRGGGHIQYDYDFYLKQAKISADRASGAHWYEGDTTIMASPTHGIGREVAKHLNEIRKHLKNKDEQAAQDYSNKHMHVGWDEVKSWFVGYKDAEGKYQVPRLSLNEDIRVVPKNKKISDIDTELRFRYNDFRDGTREGSLAAQNQVAFTEERDAFELLGVNVKGTKANPLYSVAPAAKIDPITTMNRGLANIARSNFMDDYKTMAVEHWLQQAKSLLDVKNINELYHSPFYHFNETRFLPATTETAETQLRLEAAKYHIQQLTGQPSVTDTLLHSAAQKLADSAFSAFGPKGLVLTPTWLLPKLRDPFAFGRSIAFNVKLGLFNIPQFIVQAGNYANILGIAGPKYAAPGTMAAQLHFWSTVNSHPNIVAHLDNIATKLNLPGASRWRPGEFTEAMTEMNRTGFGHVGGEMATLDNPMNTKIIKNASDTFLDWGAYPFQAGERNARYGAWYTAYREFRDVNPIGRITNEDRAGIMQRADLLNINMSRASSSAIHKGVFSIPTQFYTYQIRMMELMFGNRLSSTERARMFITNAALFGVPMGVAGTTGLPVADFLRRKAMEGTAGQDPYVVGDDYFKSMFMEGIPSAIGAMITGKGDPQAGTWYDIGPRFGTKGLEFLGSATQSDKGWLDVLGGPLYSILKSTISQSDGLAYAMLSLMRRDGDAFPMLVEDMADVAKEISSFNAAWRVYAASQFGRWVSKKDAYLTDTSTGQALFASLFGVKDVNIDDIQIMTNSLKSQKAYEQEVEQRFTQEFRRGMLAQQQNPELAKRFFTRAQAWLEISGIREDRMSSIVAKAMNDNQSILAKTQWDFYIRKPIGGSEQKQYNAMQNTQRINSKKAGEE